MKKVQDAKSPIGRPKGQGSRLVFDDLKSKILTLALKLGEVIDELALVHLFKVSRTPVREALIKLQVDGFVELVPNRGRELHHWSLIALGRCSKLWIFIRDPSPISPPRAPINP